MTTESIHETAAVEYQPEQIKKGQLTEAILLSQALPLGSPYTPTSPLYAPTQLSDESDKQPSLNETLDEKSASTTSQENAAGSISSGGTITTDSSQPTTIAESANSMASVDEKPTPQANNDVHKSPLMIRTFMADTLQKDFSQLADICNSVEQRMSAIPELASITTRTEQREQTDEPLQAYNDVGLEKLKHRDAKIADKGAKTKAKGTFLKKIAKFVKFEREKTVNIAEQRQSILERTYQEVYSGSGLFDDYQSSKQSSPSQNSSSVTMAEPVSAKDEDEDLDPDKNTPIYRKYIATAILYNLSKTEPPVPYMRPEAGSKTHEFESFCDDIFFGTT
ncbi:hypothetical protein BDF20DRAFT_833860 [Mycotypha africana]|uniref:uncharacterized protein n=1 Tax=Mycotypha africana TaxID=64632 RepID=UPI0023015048|nr:uncharacterized protein BDF20DRAFT_833860 [Mycotypha africana]KAI8984348.1 hypothetical protein BDF20DRAFT_833860 [Mycotypha africana]